MRNKILWSLMTLLSLLIVLVVSRYLTLDPDVFFPEQRAIYLAHLTGLMVHVIGSMVALALGPFLFLPALRKKWPALHRWLGRVYLLGNLFGGVAGLTMSTYAYAGDIARNGFATLGLLWLAAGLMAMSQLRERNRLAEAMHDTIGHTLTSAIVSLEGVALLLATRPQEAMTLLDSVREQLQSGLGDIRQTVRTLKTDTLAEHATLRGGLCQLVDRVGRQTTVALDLDDQLTVTLLPIQEYVLYSIVREGITNALNHSQATQIRISLTESAPEQITLTDNGVGTDAFTPGFGLTHLEQKVTALGGVMTVATETGSGFRLQATLPLTVDLLLQPQPATGQKGAPDD